MEILTTVSLLHRSFWRTPEHFDDIEVTWRGNRLSGIQDTGNGVFRVFFEEGESEVLPGQTEVVMFVE